MEIIKLNIKNCKLYSPSTGELIYDSAEDYLNEDAKSLAGFWHFNSDQLSDYYGFHLVDGDVQDYIRGATINDPDLKKSWEYFLHECSHDIPIHEKEYKDAIEHDEIDIESFIFEYDCNPRFLCFYLEDAESRWNSMFLVIDMNMEVGFII